MVKSSSAFWAVFSPLLFIEVQHRVTLASIKAVKYCCCQTWHYNATLFTLCVHNLIGAKLWQSDTAGYLYRNEKVQHCKDFSVEMCMWPRGQCLGWNNDSTSCKSFTDWMGTSLDTSYNPCGSSGSSVSPLRSLPFMATCLFLTQKHTVLFNILQKKHTKMFLWHTSL